YIEDLRKKHNVTQKKTSAQKDWDAFKLATIDHPMFNKIVKKRIQDGDKTTVLALEAVLQDRTKKKNSKENKREEIVEKWEEAEATRKRTALVEESAHSVRERIKRARLLEGPAEGINVQVFWVDPVIFSKTPQAREIWYNPHISDDRAHIWTNYITLDNYSFEELVERCHEPLEVEEDRYI